MANPEFDKRHPTSDRYKSMIISYNDMMRMMCGELVITNIPDWTRLVSVSHSFRRRGWILLIEHPSFPKVEPNSYCDDLVAEFKEIKLSSEVRKLTFD